MAGGDPASASPQDDHHLESHQSSMVGSYRDRSVTEIETSFSEHFIATVDDEEDDNTPVNIEDMSSSEFNIDPDDPLNQSAMQDKNFQSK